MLLYPRGRTVSSQRENIVCVHGLELLAGIYHIEGNFRGVQCFAVSAESFRGYVCCPMGTQMGGEFLLI